MKQYLNNLVNFPFKVIEDRIFNIRGEKYWFPNEHSGTFTTIPEIFRRCHFLSSTEKEVLYELISWASTTKAYHDGYCKVTESHIRVNTNLGLSTVKKAISSLSKKGFISKSLDFDRRNIYRINDAYKNPYIVLSEWVHYYRRRTIDSWSAMLIEEPEPGIDYLLSKKHFIEATMIFVNEEKHYAKYIILINELLNDIFDSKIECYFTDEIEKAYKATTVAIFSIYENL